MEQELDDPFGENLDLLANTANAVTNLAPAPPPADAPEFEPVTPQDRKRLWFVTVNDYTDVTIARIKSLPDMHTTHRS